MRKPVEFNQHPHQVSRMTYRGVVKHVVDGDTLDVLLDQGLNQYSYITVRVRRIDTPELIGSTVEEKARAETARQFVRDLLLDRPVLVTTIKDGVTFGRYVADITYWDTTETQRDLAATLVHHGLGVEIR